MDTYTGIDVVKALKRYEQAECISGVYVYYRITKDEFGSITWLNGEVVGLNKFFMESEWKILK